MDRLIQFNFFFLRGVGAFLKSSKVLQDPVCLSFPFKYHENCKMTKKFGKIERVIFYTEILTGKAVLWCFFSSETSEKIHNSTFQVKISV